MTDHPLARTIFAWAEAEQVVESTSDQYCPTRDVLRARLDGAVIFLNRLHYPEGISDILNALLSEIGGNSFDHNLARWKDIPGVCFAKEFFEASGIFVLADRGQGIRTTLQRVVPSIRTDEEALHVAFLERISGRAPEHRGNGLKFVRQTIMEDGIDLFFQSGTATYSINHAQETWQSAKRGIPGCFAILSYARP